MKCTDCLRFPVTCPTAKLQTFNSDRQSMYYTHLYNENVCNDVETVCLNYQPKVIESDRSIREFKSGAVRDIVEGKGRCDLLPFKQLSEVISDYSQLLSNVFNYVSDFQQSGDVTFLHCVVKAILGYSDIEYKLLQLSKHFENGAIKYGEHNWEKGIPVHSYIDSGIRHLLKYLNNMADEDHYTAAIWNFLCAIHTVVELPEYNDFSIKN